MNDHTELELRNLVERVVRPVVAIRASKRKMREELLAHLTAAFEVEFTAIASEPEALERTRQRFGDAAETTAALQASISTPQRPARVMRPRSGPRRRPRLPQAIWRRR